MIIIHTDQGPSTSGNVIAFCDALNISPENRFLNIRLDASATVIRNIRDSTKQVAIVLAHGLPSASELRRVSASHSLHVVRIALSTGNAVLKYRNYYESNVSEFSWPNASGQELVKLGAYLRDVLTDEELNDPARLLDALHRYYNELLVSDDLIAAYLLKIACDRSDYVTQLNELKLDKKFSSYSIDDFLSSLNGRLVEPVP